MRRNSRIRRSILVQSPPRPRRAHIPLTARTSVLPAGCGHRTFPPIFRPSTVPALALATSCQHSVLSLRGLPPSRPSGRAPGFWLPRPGQIAAFPHVLSALPPHIRSIRRTSHQCSLSRYGGPVSDVKRFILALRMPHERVIRSKSVIPLYLQVISAHRPPFLLFAPVLDFELYRSVPCTHVRIIERLNRTLHSTPPARPCSSMPTSDLNSEQDTATHLPPPIPPYTRSPHQHPTGG
ncbi:hypothetical protein GY45DRAFT_934081 [Cubamyces sp. BRFM 1775]|nr:hypothetical protein GY45DRAFT_934081 [Cubamyces sp. BRFM 1775]